jgi:very-short-patch-repair endonuclease
MRVRVAGASHYQDVLTWLRACADGNLPIALYPEPDNPHDPNAVAVIAAGWRAGYLSRNYAVLWQPVVLAEHAAGRAIIGEGQFTDTQTGTGLTATVTQPSPPLTGEPATGPPLPTGEASVQDFWPRRELTRKARRQHRRAATRQRQALLRDGVLDYGAADMTSTEAKLHHYLAQCPEPFLFYPQVPFSSLRLDFYCPFARLCVEVDGPEHSRPDRKDRDRWRNRFLRNRGITTYRITNKRVDANPSKAAMAAFRAACRNAGMLPPSDPGSPYYGWLPAPPLRPLQKLRYQDLKSKRGIIPLLSLPARWSSGTWK